MWILVLYDQQGRELQRLPLEGAPLTVGRGKDRDLVLDSKAVSRQHARIEAQGGSAILVDLGSANGTLLNGRRIDKPVALKETDAINIAGFGLRLLRGPAGQGTADRTAIQPVSKLTDPAPSRPAADFPEIKVPVRPAAAEAAPVPAETGDWNSASELLDKQLRSIRSFRGEAQQEPGQKLTAFEQDWDKVVNSMRELQQQLQGDPRVLLFGISRNNREITAKIADPGAKRGHAYLILSPEHPEGKFRDQLTVWLREFGQPDINYDEPREAMRHFVERIAKRLA
ncbi:MAG: FHA domain-containing protein [Nevskiales bacterium]